MHNFTYDFRTIIKIVCLSIVINIIMSTVVGVPFNFLSALLFVFILNALVLYIVKYRNFDIKILNKGSETNIPGQYLFLTCFAFIFIAFSLLLKMHFTADTYVAYYNVDETLRQVSVSGRLIVFFVISMFAKLKINEVVWQGIFTLLLFIVSAFSAALLIKKFIDLSESCSTLKALSIALAILISFINVFIVEWYLFPEVTFTFAISLLTVTLAIHFFEKEDSLKNSLISFLFLCISLNTYQATIGIYLIYAITISVIKNNGHDILNLAKQIIKIIFISAAASLSNIILIKIMLITGFISASRGFAFESIQNNFIEILIRQPQIIKNLYGMMPEYVVPLFCIATIVIFLAAMNSHNQIRKEKVVYFLTMVLGYAFVFAPHLITTHNWMPQRTLVSLFAYISCIYLIIISSIRSNIMHKLVISILGLFLFINVFQIHDISINHLASNRIDNEICNIIYQNIVEYEIDSGIEVVDIAISVDANPAYHYQSIKYSAFDTNIRSLVASWSDVYSINYYSGRHFNEIKMPEEIFDKYFKNKEWDYFEFDEQAVFIDDKLYFMVY